MADACDVVLDAATHQGAPQTQRRVRELRMGEPAHPDDRAIGRAWHIAAVERAAERYTKEAAAGGVGPPHVDTHDRLRTEPPAGFLEGLAHHGVHEALAVLEMTGGLIEHQSTACALLDQQKFSVTLGDRSHRMRALATARRSTDGRAARVLLRVPSSLG